MENRLHLGRSLQGPNIVPDGKLSIKLGQNRTQSRLSTHLWVLGLFLDKPDGYT